MASMSTTVLDSDDTSDDLTGETDNEINSFTMKNNLDIARQDKGSESRRLYPTIRQIFSTLKVPKMQH